MNSSSDQLLNTQSLGFAEDFTVVDEAVLQARKDAVRLGAPSLTTGALGFLRFIAKAIGAKHAVEIGTSLGASGLALHQGMGEDSVLTSIDAKADLQHCARENFQTAGLKSRHFRLIAGNPMDVLNNLRSNAYDLVFINGDKLEYVEYISQALRLLRSGGVLVVHDVLWRNLVAHPADESDETLIIREALDVLQTDETLKPVIIPLGDGLAVCVKN